MMQETDFKPFLLFLDTVQNSIDEDAFIEYIKNLQKKEICIINAYDFAEKEPSKQHKSNSKCPLNTGDGSPNCIVKGIKGRIELEMQRIKSIIAQEHIDKEKEMKQKSRSSKSKSSKTKAVHVETPSIPVLFEGLFDLLVIVLSFPYKTEQVMELKSQGLSMMSFISLLPEKTDPIPTEYTPKPLEKSTGIYAKKVPIPGSEYDSNICPECYPPARWLAMQQDIPADVPFIEVKCGENNEATLMKIEEAIVKIFGAMKRFNELFNNTSFVKLPIIESRAISTDDFKRYLIDNSNDYSNAIYHQLKQHDFCAINEKKITTDDEKFDQLFDASYKEITRKVTTRTKEEEIDPYFELKYSPFLCNSLYEVIHWKRSEDDASTTSAILNFIKSPNNFYCYAGQKFDSIVSLANKKYSLGLSMSSYDWEKWNYCKENDKINEYLEYVLSSSGIVEKQFDKETGMMWILAMEPVTKQIGQERRQEYFPQTMNGISEFINELFNQEKPAEEKKTKNVHSIATKIRAKENVLSLMKDPVEAIKERNVVYEMPLKISRALAADSPFLFESGLSVHVHRNIINSFPTLNLDIKHGESLIRVLDDSIEQIVTDDLKFIKYNDGTFSILFYDQAIYYNGKDLYTKSANFDEIILTGSGALITSAKDGKKRICFANGTIAEFNEEANEWRYVDKDGNARIRKEDGSCKQLNLPHSFSRNVGKKLDKMIRPDNIEYYINSDKTRKIFLTGELTIEQSDDEITYEIPNMPLISYSAKSGFSISIDVFEVSFNNNNNSISITSEKSNVVSHNETGITEVTFDNEEAWLDQKNQLYQFKSGSNVLVVDAKGEQRVGQIDLSPAQKKKADCIESRWGKLIPNKEVISEQNQVILQDKFISHFFAIKSDLSYTEFLPIKSINVGSKQQVNKGQVMHPCGEYVNVMTIHDPENPPSIYIEHKGQTKLERSNVLKGLHIPKKSKSGADKSCRTKKSKGDEVNDDVAAENAINDMSFTKNIFLSALSDYLEKSHQEYLISIQPEEEEPPEIPMIPPRTPNPSLLTMMQFYHEPKAISKDRKQSVLNYWELHESDFAYPIDIEHRPARPVSARRMLNDPPRFFDQDKQSINEDDFQITRVLNPRIPKSARSVKARDLGENKEVDNKVKLSSKVINFGKVKANTSAKSSFEFCNVSKKPIHFSVVFPAQQCSRISIKAIPGVMMPGLKKKLMVHLLPSNPQNIKTSFCIKTDSGQMNVDVIAEIVE